jgi:metal-responsive CopG/Arc/MetJ family transcriptional regulator
MDAMTAVRSNTRLNMSVTKQLAQLLELWAERQKVSRSEIGRIALQEYLEKLEREKREQEIIDACTYYRELDLQLAQEWEAAETRI